MAAGPRNDPGLAHPECQLKLAARRPWRRCAQRPRHQLHRDDSLFSNLLVRVPAEVLTHVLRWKLVLPLVRCSTRQSGWWARWWWKEQSSLQSATLVFPPRDQGTTWWASQKAAGMVQPTSVQPASRRFSALRMASVT